MRHLGKCCKANFAVLIAQAQKLRMIRGGGEKGGRQLFSRELQMLLPLLPSPIAPAHKPGWPVGWCCPGCTSAIGKGRPPVGGVAGRVGPFAREGRSRNTCQKGGWGQRSKGVGSGVGRVPLGTGHKWEELEHSWRGREGSQTVMLRANGKEASSNRVSGLPQN
jgi:hypothetical protein